MFKRFEINKLINMLVLAVTHLINTVDKDNNLVELPDKSPLPFLTSRILINDVFNHGFTVGRK